MPKCDSEQFEDRNVYKQVAPGVYKPFGVTYDERYLPDGLWYCRHHEHVGGYGETSIKYIGELFKVGDAKDIDVLTLAGMEKLCDRIYDSQEYQDMMRTGCSLNDVVHLCVKVLTTDLPIEKYASMG